MSNINTIRAWKDEEYRQALTEAERELLPEHPAGATDLSDEQLTNVNGSGACYHTYGCFRTGHLLE